MSGEVLQWCMSIVGCTIKNIDDIDDMYNCLKMQRVGVVSCECCIMLQILCRHVRELKIYHRCAGKSQRHCKVARK